MRINRAKKSRAGMGRIARVSGPDGGSSMRHHNQIAAVAWFIDLNAAH